MSSARKYLALALAACKSKQYEEAGIFLQQASTTEGSDSLIDELGANGDDTVAIPGAPEKMAAAPKSEEDDGDVDSVEPSEEEPVNMIMASDESDDDTNGSEEDDWTDNEDEASQASTSSVTRRKFTSLFHIGKILAASMSAAEDEDDDEENPEDVEGNDSEDADETQLGEPDPDIPGQNLIPASFSSVKVVTRNPAAVRSPVKLRQ